MTKTSNYVSLMKGRDNLSEKKKSTNFLLWQTQVQLVFETIAKRGNCFYNIVKLFNTRKKWN